jgi:hypothetical protein
VGLLALVGCSKTATVDSNLDIPEVDLTAATFTLCKDCGEVKGSDKCCVEGAEMCECGFVHGSPACCKVDKTGEDITLCAKCGFVAGSDQCCAEGAEMCDCGFVHGSPACCKVDKETLAAAPESKE